MNRPISFGLLVVMGTAGALPGVPATAGTPVATQATSPIACAHRNLHNAPRGARIRETVHLAGRTARLTAVSRNPTRGAEPDNAVLRHGRVSVSDNTGRATSYPLHDNRFYRPKAEYVAKVRVQGSGGYLCLIRFQPSQPPVAVIAVNPGCMGGCPRLVFLSSGSSRRSLQVGPGGFKVTRVSTVPIIVTDDFRFFGRFSDGADSLDPVRVFTVDHGRRANITGRFPGRLRHDAARAYGLFRRPSNGPHAGLGALAAWAGDECVLGRQSFVWHKLHRLRAAGRLHGSAGEPGGRRFVHHLRSFLARTGYLS